MKIVSYMPKQGKRIASIFEMPEKLEGSCQGCCFFSESEGCVIEFLSNLEYLCVLCAKNHIIYELKGV